MTARLLVGAFLAAALITSCGTAPSLPWVPTLTPTAAPTSTPDPTETVTPLPLTEMSACVETNSLRVRDRPSKDATIVSGLNRGSCVTVTGKDASGSWISIRHEDLVGWVALQYVALQGDLDQLQVVAIAPGTEKVADLLPVAPPPTSVPPTETKIPTATEIPPTATGTATEIPPTATLTGTATASATATEIPPSPTPTATNTPLPPTPDIPSCWNTASRTGEWLSCRVWTAYCSHHPEIDGSPTICNDAPYPNSQFNLLVWGSNWSDLNGKCIVVTGRVLMSGGKPQIVATSRSQVSICQ